MITIKIIILKLGKVPNTKNKKKRGQGPVCFYVSKVFLKFFYFFCFKLIFF